MGQQLSAASADPANQVEGHYTSDWKTGFRWCADPIVSNSAVEKKPWDMGGEVWGPYKKTFTKSIFGQWLFTPPESIDDVPILCRCRDIPAFMRDRNGDLNLGAEGAMLVGANLPTCWEDDMSLWDFNGGDTFRVHLGHPSFYLNFAAGLATDILQGGRRTTKRRHRSKLEPRGRRTKRQVR